MTKTTRTKMRWRWGYSVLTQAEGGPNTDWLLRAVRKTGARARRESSPFVGHTSIVIETPTKALLLKALSALVKAGELDGPARSNLAWAEEI